MLRLIVVFSLALVLAACAGTGPPTAEELERRELRKALLPTLQYRIAGVRYAVGRVPGEPGNFEIFTVEEGNGTQKGMFQALRRAYNCQSIRLTETVPTWREATARGAFCNGGQGRFR